jgi:hypothetical protein
VLPLSNDTVRKRIDEIAVDLEEQLIVKLRQRPFTLQIDEATFCGSVALILAYVRYVEDGSFHEEMLLCGKLETTATGNY